MTVSRSTYCSALNFYGNTDPAALIKRFGSPLYVYNEDILRRCCGEMKTLAEHPNFTACYSTKANGNLHLLRIIHAQGLIADAMSPGELAVLKKAGFSKQEICYVCNNVSAEELHLAHEEAAHVSVDSLSQLDTFGQLHPGGYVMVRVNPGIGAGHHAKVVTAGKKTKFGVTPEDFQAMREILQRHNLTLLGLNQHLGSLFMEPDSFLEAADWLLNTARDFSGLRIIDFGGGYGIPYHKYELQARLDLDDLRVKFTTLLNDFCKDTGYDGEFIIEPGRYIAAECGLLLGTVHAVKNNGPDRYVGTDLGFNVLARPILYDAFHDIELYPAATQNCVIPERREMVQTIVGNICESGDILAKERLLPEAHEGDIIGVLDAGAYGMAMSSNYNLRLRPAEVLIRSDGTARLIRMRDTIEDLLAPFGE